MSIWSAAVTMPTICGSVGAPPLCAFVPVGSSATANAIATAADKTLLCIIVFNISMFPFLIFLSFYRLTSFGHTIRSLLSNRAPYWADSFGTKRRIELNESHVGVGDIRYVATGTLVYGRLLS